MGFIKPIDPAVMARFWSHPTVKWVSAIRREVDMAASCEAPIMRNFVSAPSKGDLLWVLQRHPKEVWAPPERGIVRSNIRGCPGIEGWWRESKPRVADRHPPAIYADVWVPCKRCKRCLAARAAHWRIKALSELASASRTWFVTFTFNPQTRLRIDIQRGSRADPAHWGRDEVFADRIKCAGRYLTLYFKRLRKNTGAPLRYVLVSEAHKDGWPHYHGLLHERGVEVGKRDIQTCWSANGFSSAKLVAEDDKGAARYVTKYISKDAVSRIRASIRYGTVSGSALCRSEEIWPPMEQMRERVEKKLPNPEGASCANAQEVLGLVSPRINE